MSLKELKIGDFIVSEDDGSVFAVIAKREQSKGTVVTVITSDDVHTDKRSTQPITELPSGWTVKTGEQLYDESVL